ncbi:rhamnan synthesis F family protein [Falsiroseomonas sp. HW251]|uniref:rhamnan synthesis F family protein n=1 Tax=Falsiroseomonas sp. HW251 TaxID=3390998 RepID=UPI003D319B97
MSLRRFAMAVWRRSRQTAIDGAAKLEGAVVRFDTRPRIRAETAGSGAGETPGARVVVFCHYDRRGRIWRHTRDYLDSLREAGFAVVFVSNGAPIAPEDRAWILARAWRVIERENVGYDFGAWRDGIAACGLPRADTALLAIANDSVYGPFAPVARLVDRMDFGEADVWGVTDSWQHRWHLQTYLVVFGRRVLRDPAFGAFWSGVPNRRLKRGVVLDSEIGLTRAMMAAGLRCRALWPYTDVLDHLRRSAEVAAEEREAPPPDPMTEASERNRERVLRAAARRVPLNPTADLWRALLEQGCPFLKRELLRDNPGGVQDVAAWRDVLAQAGHGDPEVILRDLERSLRNRAP